MSDLKATPKNQVIHSPLRRFRIRAHCSKCAYHDTCLSDRTMETRCILALIADSLHMNTQLNKLRSAHL